MVADDARSRRNAATGQDVLLVAEHAARVLHLPERRRLGRISLDKGLVAPPLGGDILAHDRIRRLAEARMDALDVDHAGIPGHEPGADPIIRPEISQDGQAVAEHQIVERRDDDGAKISIKARATEQAGPEELNLRPPAFPVAQQRNSLHAPQCPDIADQISQANQAVRQREVTVDAGGERENVLRAVLAARAENARDIQHGPTSMTEPAGLPSDRKS